MAKSKAQKKTKQSVAQETPKSTLKKKKEEAEATEEPEEVETPKSAKKGRPKRNAQVVTLPQIETSTLKSDSEKKSMVESPPVIKKEKIVFDMLPEDIVEEETEMMEVSVQFPRLSCYKSALLQLLDTDKPVVLKEPLNLVIQYTDRYEAVEAMERLNGITEESKLVTAKLRHLGQSVPDKRVVYVPKKAPIEEAISVLKKVYGANMVEAKNFANESKMMLLSFGSEEDARAADKIKNKSYHGMELKIGSFFAPKKRGLDDDDSKQTEAKKSKKEETNTNGDSEMKEEKSEEENENGNEETAEDNEEAANEDATDVDNDEVGAGEDEDEAAQEADEDEEGGEEE